MEQHLDKLFEQSEATIKVVSWRREALIKRLMTLPVQWDKLVNIDVLSISAITGETYLEVEFADGASSFFGISISDEEISFMPI